MVGREGWDGIPPAIDLGVFLRIFGLAPTDGTKVQLMEEVACLEKERARLAMVREGGFGDWTIPRGPRTSVTNGGGVGKCRECGAQGVRAEEGGGMVCPAPHCGVRWAGSGPSPVLWRDGRRDSIRCENCNAPEAELVNHADEGELVCSRCGRVAMDHILHQGVSERRFDGETDDPKEDRSHAGFPLPFSRVLSDEYQLQTIVSIPRDTPGSVLQPRSKRRKVHVYGGIQPDEPDHKPSKALTDRDKLEAIQQFEQAVLRANVCARAVDDAVDLFAALRDTKERVMDKGLRRAACLWIAHFAHVARRPMQLPSAARPEPTFPCSKCLKAFHTGVERAAHLRASPECSRASNKFKRAVIEYFDESKLDELTGAK